MNTRVSAGPKVLAIFWPKPKLKPKLDFLAETETETGRTLIIIQETTSSLIDFDQLTHLRRGGLFN